MWAQICQRSRGRTCFHLRDQLKRGCSALSHKPKSRLIRVIGTVHSVPVQRHALHALVAQVRHDLVAHSMTILSRRSRSEEVFSALLPRISSTRGVGPFNVRRRLGTSCAALPAASPVSCSEFLSIGGVTNFNIRDAWTAGSAASLSDASDTTSGLVCLCGVTSGGVSGKSMGTGCAALPGATCMPFVGESSVAKTLAMTRS